MLLVKPYPGACSDISQRTFYYRLSRARRTIENAFGILAYRFRVFRRPINCHEDRVIQITKAVYIAISYEIVITGTLDIAVVL